MRQALWAGIVAAVMLAGAVARAEVLCTLVTDVATGAVLHAEGACDARVTPASTFKIALAVMGYEAGVLRDAGAPVLTWRAGEPDWGGAAWTGAVDPEAWMRESVLWYSQRLAREMGAATLTGFARQLGYGNADFSGDPGFDNGLERAWIASSLQVSPREQAAFLRALVQDQLPVRAQAMAQARGLLERHVVGAWVIRGKTGTAYPRRADRSFDNARGWGWYVGWAERGDRRLVFVRLTQAQARSEVSPGIATRDTVLRDWADLAGR